MIAFCWFIIEVEESKQLQTWNCPHFKNSFIKAVSSAEYQEESLDLLFEADWLNTYIPVTRIKKTMTQTQKELQIPNRPWLMQLSDIYFQPEFRRTVCSLSEFVY